MTPEALIQLDRISERALVFEGDVTPADLPRLAESLANEEGRLHYTVSARLDRQRRKVVSCIIEGFVFLMCQSTLEAFRHAISIDDRLVLVDDESALPPIEEESDTEDYMVADEPIDVLALVEDAVLLSLPMVPRKPGLEEQKQRKTKERLESPFAALASLKKRK